MAKYRVGQELTYKPLNQRVIVAHVTPYHESEDPHAKVTIRLKSGDLRDVPVLIQEDYLTVEAPLPMFKKWPLPKQ
jgi:hypothetical protein